MQVADNSTQKGGEKKKSLKIRFIFDNTSTTWCLWLRCFPASCLTSLEGEKVISQKIRTQPYSVQSTTTGHKVTSDLRTRTLIVSAILYRRPNPQKSQKSSRSGMRSIKLFISQWTLKTRFWMQVSTPNTFPQVLFKVLTPARHQSKMKYQYNYMTFLSKKPTDSGNPTQLCREDEHLPTENRKKWRNSSVLSVTKDTGKFLPSEDTTLHLMFSVPTFLVKQWLGKFVRATHHWHILESSYRTKTTRTKHGLFSSIFHSNFKYS